MTKLIKTVRPFLNVGGVIKATGANTFSGHLVRWHDPKRKDLSGEWFSKQTNFLQSQGYPIKGRPINYQHGMDDEFGFLPIGMYTFADEDDIGLFVEGQLNTRAEYEDMLREIGRIKGLRISDATIKNRSDVAFKAVSKLVASVPMQQSMGADVATYRVNEENGHIDYCGIVHGALTPTPADDMNPVVQFKSAWQYVTQLDDERTTFIFQDLPQASNSQPQTVNPSMVNPTSANVTGDVDGQTKYSNQQENYTMAKKSLKEMTPEEDELLRSIIKEIVLELSDESGMDASEEDVLAMADEVEEEIKTADEEEIKAMGDEDDDTTKAEDLDEDEITKRVKKHFELPKAIKKHLDKQMKLNANRKSIASGALNKYKQDAPTVSKKSQMGGYRQDGSNGVQMFNIGGRAEKPTLKSFVRSVEDGSIKATNPYIGNQGGYLTGQEFANEILDPLRAKVTMFDMGVRSTSVSNIGIYTVPKMTTAPTAYRPGINQTVTDSTPTYDTINAYLRPIAAQVIISKQMLATSAFDFQTQVTDQLVKSLRLQIDSEILFGAGTVVNGTGAEIKGILSVLEENATLASTNVVTLATNGRKPKYTDLIAAETQIATGNVELDDQTSGWVIHPRTRGTLRSLQTTTGEPLLFDNYGQKPYQEMIGYKVGLTTQVPINITTGTDTATSYIFAGNYFYSEYVMANDIEIIVDEVTLADKLQTRIIAYTYSDFIVHYPEAFYVMKGVSV